MLGLTFVWLLLLLFFNKHAASRNITNHEVYNQTQALKNLYFAYGAYCRDTDIEHWDCKWCSYIPGFQVEEVINLDYLQAYVGFDTVENQIVVSFRGTHNAEDWIDDFDFVQVLYSNVSDGYVHQGIYDAWQDLSSMVMNAVEALMISKRGTNVLINGHSFGGALAQLAALSIYDYATQIQNNVKIMCYTFGSPRWGNQAMANYFNDRIYVHWRLANEKDIIPNLPPRDLGFYHTCIDIWYTNNDPLEYRECSFANGEDPNCEYIGYSIEDHMNYLDVYESC